MFCFDETKGPIHNSDLEEKLQFLRKLNGTVELHFGKQVDNAVYHNYRCRSQGYNYALVSRHLTAKDLQTYLEHPVHKEVVRYFTSRFRQPPISIDFPDKRHSNL